MVVINILWKCCNRVLHNAMQFDLKKANARFYIAFVSLDSLQSNGYIGRWLRYEAPVQFKATQLSSVALGRGRPNGNVILPERTIHE